MNWQIVMRGIQIFVLITLLYLLYHFGSSLYPLILIGIVLLLFILLKGKFYRKIEKIINKKFPTFSKLHPIIKKLIIIIIIILVYMLVKQILFFFLKLVGIDLQKIMLDTINQSIINKS